ncbi:enoyl-CoA hydratase [Ammoniphilus sp. CFH 90114]|uniref:enoyl-CoA hydratase n=1 Tax=Ammoniphilus sp. CFH 90114 TaxID=2493665 RepID=UPI00100F13DC|nr:enoyl-CoA hydratase [Ammoniphilus sp. CFH 90114]RXT08005.1 enoyl-CoA hydratase [Ammoniphilus sp. CFH 90114]
MEFLSYRTADRIGYITLRNDKQRNALSLPLIHEMEALLQQIEREQAVNVLVIEAEGKVFSSGHNLREVEGQSTQDVLHLFNECQRLMLKIRNIPQVTIAKVHGIATAAGCQLVAACDLAVSAEQAQFAAPGVHIGFFCSTPAVFISRNVGRKKAAEMLFTGDFISAQDALESGLVNKVVPQEELDKAVDELAASVARHSLHTLAIGKRGFYQQLQMDDFQALSYASEIMATNSQHPDAVEGINAFLSKRKPNWSDRA